LILAYPKDILALRIAHYLHFYAGTPTSMAASIEQVFPLWQPDEPYFGYLSGMRAFALEEAGNYTEALEMGYQAIDYHASDIWAAHAVAHVMQMQDRFEEGMQWIARMSPLWDDTNNFRYHLYWHNALFYLGLDRLNDVLTIYDTQLTDCLKDDFYLDMCNAAALLWRLECKGVNTDERWASLLPLCEKRLTDQELVFSNLHYLMAPAALGQVQLIDQGIDNLQRWSVKNNTQAQRCQLAGLDLAISLRHLAQKEYASAAEKLEKAAPHLYSIGGSHAQRQLFGQLQVYCEERAGNT
ncbi:MAG: tetratricopeptide repeat protein, partial [Gammaproteobacteria bacterium]|nr:tetratricopeptide repeat protein [Gammaproteobacteria bacterium]